MCTIVHDISNSCVWLIYSARKTKTLFSVNINVNFADWEFKMSVLEQDTNMIKKIKRNSGKNIWKSLNCWTMNNPCVMASAKIKHCNINFAFLFFMHGQMCTFFTFIET